MADNVTAEAVVTPGAVFATDDDGVAQHPYVKLEWGADNTFTKVASGAGALPIQDGGNSITVDNAALSVTGGGVEATAVRVTVASDSTGVLSVDDNEGSLTVDGTVTANAGTNLNTSLLALEAGGNLAAAAASLAVLDDWDETDRAKVNIIAGQAGVAAGVGASGATTQRVVLADSYGKTIKKAVVSLTASGNIVAAVASKSIRIFELAAQSRNDGMTLQVTDGSGGAALSLRWAFNTREGVSRIINPPAWLAKTTDNTALYATITGTGTIDIEVSYWDDDAA